MGFFSKYNHGGVGDFEKHIGFGEFTFELNLFKSMKKSYVKTSGNHLIESTLSFISKLLPQIYLKLLLYFTDIRALSYIDMICEKHK